MASARSKVKMGLTCNIIKCCGEQIEIYKFKSLLLMSNGILKQNRKIFSRAKVSVFRPMWYFERNFVETPVFADVIKIMLTLAKIKMSL